MGVCGIEREKKKERKKREKYKYAYEVYKNSNYKV